MDPIFIVAVPRSGSTMLRMILDSHPSIFAGTETPWLAGNYRLGDFGPETSIRCLYQRMITGEHSVVRTNSHISADNIRQFFGRFVKDLMAIQIKNEGKSIWVEKTPDNIIQVPFLNEIFPGAKFIHLMRDGRDVALSTIKTNWIGLHYFIGPKTNIPNLVNLRKLLNTRVIFRLPSFIKDSFLRASMMPARNSLFQNVYYPIANTYYNALFRWHKWIQIYEHDKIKYNIDNILITYEDLLLKPHETLRHIFDFIGEDWDYDILNYAEYQHADFTQDIGSDSALRFSSIEPKNVFKWKKELTSKQKKVTRKYFDHYLQSKGYENTK